MIYKDLEITARCFITGSDLYELDDDGSLATSLDIKIDHDDPEIVWYEVGDMTHLNVIDKNDERLGFVEIPTI